MTSLKTLKHTVFFLSAYLGVFIIPLSYGASPVDAQEFSLSVSPTTATITLSQENDEKTQSFTLTNNTTKSKKIFIQLFPIEEVDKLTNRPIYQPISSITDAQQSFYQSAISFEHETRKISEIVLAPKQTAVVHMTVSYRETLEEGEYYFTIGFTDNEPLIEANSQENEIIATSQVRSIVGSHVFVSLGNRISDLTIRELQADNFVSSALPTISYELQNPTSKYIKGYVNLSIYNMFTFKIAEHKKNNQIILSNHTKVESTQKNEFSHAGPLTQLSSLGVNKAILEVYDRENDRLYTREMHFVVFPFWAILMVGSGTLLAFIVIRKVKEKMN